MSACDVKTAVLSIISTLSKSLTIFNNRKDKQRVNRVAKKPEGKGCKDELMLQNSLHKRPLEIQQEYDRNRKQVGDNFDIGDSTAQLSLSEILLVLNTGLIKVICAATSDNLQDRQLSRRLLLELSEATGKDAVKALRQLRERLSGHDNTTIPLTIKPADASAQGQVNQRATNSDGTRNSACRKKPVGAPRRTQRPKPCRSATVRIAWVRPLKGKVSASQAKVANSRSNHSFPNSETKGTVPEIISQPKPSAKRTNSAISAVSELRRMPYEETGKESAHSQASMMTLDQTTSKRGLVQKEVHEGQRSARSPPVPPKIPLNSQCESPPVPPKDPIVKISRRPVSTYSFMSDSTKVGEIPEHKLPAWAPPPEDPYAGLVSAQQLKRQKRHSLMFWRK